MEEIRVLLSNAYDDPATNSLIREVQATVDRIENSWRKYVDIIDQEYILRYTDGIQGISKDEKENAYRYFYKLTHDFEKIKVAVCNGFDVVDERIGAVQKLMNQINNSKTVIITGRSGVGKTTLMFRTAMRYANHFPVFWFHLKAKASCALTEQDVISMLSFMRIEAEKNHNEALLFIDSVTFNIYSEILSIIHSLQVKYRIKIIVAERNEGIQKWYSTQAFESWRDEANYLCLASNGDHQIFDWITKDRKEIITINYGWKLKIIKNTINNLVKNFGEDAKKLNKISFQHSASVKNSSISQAVKFLLLEYYRSSDVQTKYEFEWDTWNNLMCKFLQKSEDEPTFGYIAALALYDASVTAKTLASFWGISETTFEDYLRIKFRNVDSPVIMEQEGCCIKLRLQENFVANMYFKSIDGSIPTKYLIELIPHMDAETAIEFEQKFLKKINFKKPMLFDISIEELINAINQCENFKSHLRNGNRLYSFDLARFWLAKYKGKHTECDKLLIYLYAQYSTHPRVLNELAFHYMKNEREEMAEMLFHDSMKMEYSYYTLIGIEYLYRDMGYPEKAEAVFYSVVEKNKNDSHALNELARQYTKSNRPDRAEILSLRALDVNPRNLHALKGLGLLYAEKEKFDKAEEFLSRALDVEPSHVPTLNALARIYIKNEKHDLAKEKFNVALSISPNYSHTLNAFARFHADIGEIDKAIELFENVLINSPRNMIALHELGRLYLRTGKIDEAAEKLESLGSRNIYALTELGRLYVSIGQFEDAIKTFECVIAIDMNDIHARTELGMLYAKTEHYKKAEELFKSVLEKRPEDSHALIKLARVYERQDKNRQAINTYQRIVTPECRDNITMNALANLYFKEKQLCNAENLFLKSISVNQFDARSFTGLARLYVKRNKTSKAKKMFLCSLEIEPENPITLNQIALIFANEGRMDEAEEYYVRALNINKDDIYTLSGLAKIFMKTEPKRITKAEEYLLHAKNVNPRHITTINQLAWLYLKTSRYTEAEVEFLHAVSIDSSDSHALCGLGVLYTHLERYEEAEGKFKERLKISRNCFHARRGIAKLYLKMGNYEESIEIYKWMFKLKHCKFEAIEGFFNVSFEKREYENAWKIIRPYKDLFQKNIRMKNSWERLTQMQGIPMEDLNLFPLNEIARSIENESDKRDYLKTCYERGTLSSNLGMLIAKTETGFGNIGDYSQDYCARTVYRTMCIERNGDIHIWLNWAKFEQKQKNIGTVENPELYTARWIMREIYQNFSNHRYIVIAWAKLEQWRKNFGTFESPEVHTARWILREHCLEYEDTVDVWTIWAKLEIEQKNLGEKDAPTPYTARWILRKICAKLELKSDVVVIWSKLEQEMSNIGNINNPQQYSTRWLLHTFCLERYTQDAMLWGVWAKFEQEQNNIGDVNAKFSARWIFRAFCLECYKSGIGLWDSWAKLEIEQKNIGKKGNPNPFTARWIYREAYKRSVCDSITMLNWSRLENEENNIGNVKTPAQYTARWILRKSCLKHKGDASVWCFWAEIEQAQANIGSYDLKFSAEWISNHIVKELSPSLSLLDKLAFSALQRFNVSQARRLYQKCIKDEHLPSLPHLALLNISSDVITNEDWSTSKYSSASLIQQMEGTINILSTKSLYGLIECYKMLSDADNIKRLVEIAESRRSHVCLENIDIVESHVTYWEVFIGCCKEAIYHNVDKQP
ncbi:MAG: tetratricopeptide repeat protein [Defluviitaleaceae bacterium]|nr:tetratricopeptide repeat protein [Defluviitaleaceae bacterium]MCL2274896.1 tetratricopeptide repeat protein [Defluviitaleaceae bacterium]